MDIKADHFNVYLEGRYDNLCVMNGFGGPVLQNKMPLHTTPS